MFFEQSSLNLWLLSISVFSVSIILLFILSKMAPYCGLVDTPGGRKCHEGQIPLVGGIAIFSSFFIFFLLFGMMSQTYLILIMAMSAMLIAGVLDDIFEVSPRMKLLIQLSIIVFIVLIGNVRIHELGDLLNHGSLYLDFLAIPFSVLCFVGLVNAINLMDGIDGLAGSVTVGSLFWFALAAFLLNSTASFMLCVLLISSIMGFLPFNMRHWWNKKAKVFLGDSGSMTIGLILGWLAIHLSQQTQSHIPPVVVLWLLAIPVNDTISVMIHRIIEGHNPLKASRDHLHHYLLNNGFSVDITTRILSSISFVLGGIGIGGWLLGISEYAMFLGYILLFLIHYFVRQYYSDPDRL